MADASPVSLPFAEAIGFFRQKLRLPTRTWTDIWEGMHARAFVVAGATGDALLADFQGAILKALEKGTTIDEFRRDFDRIVETHGWSYKGGRDWRTRVIFDTNLRTAYAAGRWSQIREMQRERPYLRYVAVLDDRTRPEHRKWHNTILKVDHQWWETHYPPNGWYCRCTVQSLSERDLKRLGLKVSETAPPLNEEEREIRTPSGSRKVQVPDGIDPGFAYNAGIGNLRTNGVVRIEDTEGDRAWQRVTPGNWRSEARPGLVPVDPPEAQLGPPAATPAEAVAAIERAIGGPERAFIAPDGTGVTVNAAALGAHLPVDRAPFIPFIREAIERPYEIWASFERHRETGQIVLRKRFVKAIALARNRYLLVVVQAARGRMEAYTFLPTRNANYLNRQRVGRSVFRRDGPSAR